MKQIGKIFIIIAPNFDSSSEDIFDKKHEKNNKKISLLIDIIIEQYSMNKIFLKQY